MTAVEKFGAVRRKLRPRPLTRLAENGGFDLDFEQLSFKLREFFLLETYQLQLYSCQIGSLPDEYTAYAFERMRELEQRHVDYFAEKMEEKGIAKPEIAGDTFGFLGFASAKALDLMSLKERYQTGIMVESKAAEMYYEFIQMAAGDPQLVRMLWHNRTDEEFHKFWFRANLEKIELAEKIKNV